MLKRRPTYFGPLPVCVNLSPKQIRQIHFLMTVGFDDGRDAHAYLIRQEKAGIDVPEARHDGRLAA